MAELVEVLLRMDTETADWFTRKWLPYYMDHMTDGEVFRLVSYENVSTGKGE